MGIALYRKYRPQTFSAIAGQNHIRITLENELAADSVAHAYLFTGPRGVGKTSMARIFARALNCQNRKTGEREPCNVCDSCREAAEGRSLDIVEIDAASNTGVDNVRENIIERVRFAPAVRRYKIFIIDEVHMLSSSAWNALLKTLEEPPSHAIFIMATTEINKVPATIISRCQRFDFKRIPAAGIGERLKHLAAGEGVSVDDAVIAAVVGLSDGCLRDAESLFEQVLSLDEKNIGMDEAALVLPRGNAELVSLFIGALATRNGVAALSIISRLVEEGVDLNQFVADALERARVLMIGAMGAPVETPSGDIPVARLVRIINSLMAARMELKSSPIPQLPLELVAAEFCGDAPTEAAIKNEPPAGVKPPSGKDEKDKNADEKNTPAPAAKPPIKAAADDSVSKDSGQKTAKSQSDAIFSVPLETMALRWDELCAAVQEENPSLPFILRVARPLRFEGGELVIGVQYKMHAEKLNTPKSKDSIIAGLTALYKSARISVRAEIAAPDDGKSAGGAITDGLIAQFGGAVVE
jgi:DNA polymerase-3 subunit gamma/tau